MDRREDISERRIRPALLLMVAVLVLAAGAAIFYLKRPDLARNAQSGEVDGESPKTPERKPASAPSSLPRLRAEGLPPGAAPGGEPSRSPESQLSSRLLDSALPLKARRQAARTLAKLGSEEALGALKAALKDGPPALKVAVAEVLGESPNSEARKLQLDLLNGADEPVARGAIRGLGRRGDAEATDALGALLFDAQKSAGLRTEAALALGEVQQPAALNSLTRAATQIQDEAIAEQVLQALGKRRFAETQDFFRGYLDSPDLPISSKAAALEALGGGEGEAGPFLLKYAQNQDPELRAAAVSALGALENSPELSPQLLELLKQEASPEVRAELYQALANQETYDPAAVLEFARKETDPRARLAGLDLLASACQSGATPELLSFFNQTAVPELKSRALTSEDPQSRLLSVMTLRRAGTPEASAALHDIAGQSNDPRVAAAAAERPARK